MNKRAGRGASAGDYTRIEAALAKEGPPRAVFICGEDGSLREWLVDRLRAWHRARGDECSTLSAEEDGPSAVLDHVLQAGLFASSRFIVVRDAEFLLEKKGGKGVSKEPGLLRDTLATPPEGSALALLSGRTDRKKDALERAFTREVAGWMEVILCAPLSSAQFERFCDNRASEEKIKLSAEDCAALAAFTGGRAGAAAREIQRLAVSGLGQGKDGGQTPWNAVFSWVDDLIRGRVRSPEGLDLGDPDGALMTLGLIRSRYRLALDLASGKQGLPPLYPDTRAALEGAAKRLGRRGLGDVVLGLARLDRAVRGGSLQPGEALAAASLLGVQAAP